MSVVLFCLCQQQRQMTGNSASLCVRYINKYASSASVRYCHWYLSFHTGWKTASLLHPHLQNSTRRSEAVDDSKYPALFLDTSSPPSSALKCLHKVSHHLTSLFFFGCVVVPHLPVLNSPSFLFHCCYHAECFCHTGYESQAEFETELIMEMQLKATM